ncbi:hypothetical protein [Parabacteroides gordonii]|uniref:hypothetical protein n=1 Tax=Parabacteroides gordonii TaxID=574930 RepID=UPI0026EF85B6|nr:hypothetical protein [Parabacteroides gordonii]
MLRPLRLSPPLNAHPPKAFRRTQGVLWGWPIPSVSAMGVTFPLSRGGRGGAQAGQAEAVNLPAPRLPGGQGA